MTKKQMIELRSAFQTALAKESRDFLLKAGQPHAEVDAVHDSVRQDTQTPPAGLGRVSHVAWDVARDMGRWLDDEFAMIMERLDGSVQTLPARLVLSLIPHDLGARFSSRCVLALGLVELRPPGVGMSTNGGVPLDRAVSDAVKTLSLELDLREDEVLAGLADPRAAIGVREAEVATAARHVRDRLTDLNQPNVSPGTPGDVLTAIRAAYAFRRWADVEDLPVEFLAAALQRMGIDSTRLDEFEHFVRARPDSDAPAVSKLLTSLRTVFGRNGHGA